MTSIQLVDLKGQYRRIQAEIDAAVALCMEEALFINGPQVKEFVANLAAYLRVEQVIPCANGTDALQIALMALELQPGDEVIVPAFTYVATAEVAALLGLRPVMVDVDPLTYNVRAQDIEKALSPRTKVIVPVHLFGQCADMEAILALARQHNLYVVEDTAQALGAEYTFADGAVKRAGTMGHIGCTSFFPSKNLGCFGDGGALMTNDKQLAARIQKIANHGQSKKYHHELIGINSRLDTLQAAILNVKLNYLDQFADRRMAAASSYDTHLSGITELQLPFRQPNSTHVFHQYTVRVRNGERDALKSYLAQKGIPSMVYYPLPLYAQEAFRTDRYKSESFPATEGLCASVLSLPMHTELEEEHLQAIGAGIADFFGGTRNG